MSFLKSPLKRRIQEKLKALVTSGAAPGASLALGYRDISLGVFTAGLADTRRKISVRANTFFDLASLTKIIATSSLMMRAVQEKLISVEQPLKMFFPQLASDLKDVCIADVLNHISGLPAVFEDTKDLPNREERIRHFILSIDRDYKKPSERLTVYSDVGYMLLGILLEQIFHKRLRSLLYRRGRLEFGPMGFRSGWLHALASYYWGASYVAPILSLENSKKWIQGVVQDPRAQWFDEDAGHAGLFGTALGVENWAREIYMAYHGKSSVLSDHVVRSFIDFGKESTYLYGFDRPSAEASQAGKLFSRHSTVGHLGYSGTSLWMDMEEGYRVTLLTHRFAPGTEPERLKELRPAFHDWLIMEVFSRLTGTYG